MRNKRSSSPRIQILNHISFIYHITIILNGLLRRMNSRRHETEQALAEVDKDDDGFVNYAEFVKFMKSS